MCGFGLHVGFGAAAPDHDESGKVVRFAELLDIVHHLFGKIHLVLAGFHVRPLQPFDVVLAENGSPWFDLFDLGPNRVEETLFENTRLRSTFVAVVLINVPAAEGKIIERRKWHEILDLRDSSLCPLTKPNGSQLRQRSNRLRNFLFDSFHTGDERCADCTHARNQNAELPGWCFYFEAFLYHFPSCETGAVYYEPVSSLNRALRRHIPNSLDSFTTIIHPAGAVSPRAVQLANRKSRFIRAITSRRISFGQTASHSPILVQLPNISCLTCATIFKTR